VASDSKLTTLERHSKIPVEYLESIYERVQERLQLPLDHREYRDGTTTRLEHRKGCLLTTGSKNNGGYATMKVKYTNIDGEKVDSMYYLNHMQYACLGDFVDYPSEEVSHRCHNTDCGQLEDPDGENHIPKEPRNVNEQRKNCNKLRYCPSCLQVYIDNLCYPEKHQFEGKVYLPCIKGEFDRYKDPTTAEEVQQQIQTLKLCIQRCEERIQALQHQD